mmetsp:Transcript_1143/g.2078  ORF Transcript_1143/g.2078 Transcript_1143/m.2078 type:complete len:320 (-) Transcript_1143:736-1695(-)
MTSNPRRNKVLVPDIEYNAALATLNNVILPSTCSSSSNDPSSSSSSIRKDIYNSILGTIQRSMEPIPPVEFENMQKFASTPIKRQLEKIMEKGVTELNEEELSVSSCSTVDGDDGEVDNSESSGRSDVEDEEELLDHQVWVRAKELRQNVRIASRKLQLTREEKISQALSHVQNEIDNLIRLEKEWNDAVEGKYKNDKQQQEQQTDGENVDTKEMEMALDNIKNQLEDFENILPDNLQAIRDTIESVSYSLEKKMRHDLSRTERAIQLRDCDDVWKRRTNMKSMQGNQDDVNGREDGDMDGRSNKMDAAKRFAMFVSKV